MVSIIIPARKYQNQKKQKKTSRRLFTSFFPPMEQVFEVGAQAEGLIDTFLYFTPVEEEVDIWNTGACENEDV